ncbi:MAG: YggS family pyridoxal phosphate-dependent enzyme [Phycisphaeraceae bacterium]|nr:YggS family pyridoxal phosphate-dependent enzyme [Phycisphaeraceae bacterium]
MTTIDSIHERYIETTQRVAAAAAAAGRPADEIILVAVTKYAEPDQIKSLIDLGHRDFGENQAQQLQQRAAMIQEYMDRRRVLQGLLQSHATQPLSPDAGPIRWHMIGHLQKNKVRRLADSVRLIHSVDSLRLAEEIQQAGLASDRVHEVLIQVNASGEASKSGCPVPAVVPLAEQIDSMVNVRLRGLMTMAPEHASSGEIRRTFARTRELFEDLRRAGVCDSRCNLLSMGMSGDFELAISEGANLVRLGSIIFGEPAADR